MPTFVTYDADGSDSESDCSSEPPACSVPPARRSHTRAVLEVDPEQWHAVAQALVTLIAGLRMQRDGLRLQRDAQALIGEAFAHEASIDFEKEIAALDQQIAAVQQQLDAARYQREAVRQMEREAQRELGESADERRGKRGLEDGLSRRINLSWRITLPAVGSTEPPPPLLGTRCAYPQGKENA